MNQSLVRLHVESQISFTGAFGTSSLALSTILSILKGAGNLDNASRPKENSSDPLLPEEASNTSANIFGWGSKIIKAVLEAKSVHDNDER